MLAKSPVNQYLSLSFKSSLHYPLDREGHKFKGLVRGIDFRATGLLPGFVASRSSSSTSSNTTATTTTTGSSTATTATTGSSTATTGSTLVGLRPLAARLESIRWCWCPSDFAPGSDDVYYERCVVCVSAYTRISLSL